MALLFHNRRGRRLSGPGGAVEESIDEGAGPKQVIQGAHQRAVLLRRAGGGLEVGPGGGDQ